ncbi:MAG: methyl-accepting chemotaxis protein [Anaerolineaceae bacterium]|nr:methyl-accepting chemotaxis protein [Anaerolineaceae bacterium]
MQIPTRVSIQKDKFAGITTWATELLQKTNLKLGTKLSIGFVSLLMLTILLGTMSFGLLESSKGQISDVRSKQKQLVLTMQIQKSFMDAVSSNRGYMAYGDEKYNSQFQQAMTNTLALEQELLKITEKGKKGTILQLFEDTKKYYDLANKDLYPAAKTYNQELLANNLVKALALRDEVFVASQVFNYLENQVSLAIQSLVQENNTVTESNLESTLANANWIIVVSAGISVLAILFGTCLAIVFTRMVRTPVINMLNRANECAEGDLRHSIDSCSRDELGELAIAFNKMMASFKSIIGSIAGHAEQVSAASQELMAISGQSKQASVQVAESIDKVTEGATKQLESMDQVSSAVGHITEKIQYTATNADVVSESSDQAVATAIAGSGAIDNAISQMSNIQNTVVELEAVVRKLGERSQHIGNIVGTITAIASQTNLLALNAAIEAARAGEQGRGFAVVAEEVRKLAEQSETAAKQIAGLITEIQEDTGRVITVMGDNSREVRKGTEVMADAGKSFGHINQLVSEVSSQVKEISQSIQEISAGSKNILDTVRKVEGITQDAVGQTHTVSAATEEQVACLGEITQASESLAKRAEDLQLEISSFRI